MKKIYYLLTLLLFTYVQSANAQMGINSTGAVPDVSAMLDVSSTNKGVLIPRIALTATNSNAPVGASITISLLVYNTATAGVFPTNVLPGFYYWNGTKWVSISDSSSGWSLLGNSGSVDGTNFIGNTDNVPLNFRVNNQSSGKIDPIKSNSFYGHFSGYSNNLGQFNAAFGKSSLYSNTDGNFNTANGNQALNANTTGSQNTANGANSLNSNTIGSANTAFGYNAMFSNSGGNNGTAFGTNAMYYTNSTATAFTNTNVAVGFESLRGSFTASANTGLSNTAVGYQTLLNNSTGSFNTANGSYALLSNTTGKHNVAYGASALRNNIIGTNNVAIGTAALYNNNTNGYVAVGDSAMYYQNSSRSDILYPSVAIGYKALFGGANMSLNTGLVNVAVGSYALANNTEGDLNSAVGHNSLSKNTKGAYNTSVGGNSLKSNTEGNYNTAIGETALNDNTTGGYNTVIGSAAMFSNKTGSFNVAIGGATLRANITGIQNVAIGIAALNNNVAGNNATAIGWNSMLYSNTSTTPFDNTNVAVGYQSMMGVFPPSANTGLHNTALGYQSLKGNSTGDYNTANGLTALLLNTTGDRNTALGAQSLGNNTTGTNNTAVGVNALFFKGLGDNNTALGNEAGLGISGNSFTQCTFIGAVSSPTVNRTNVTMLGYGIANAQCTGDNQVLLGNTSVSQIRAQITSITAYSDKRFKSNISDNIPGLAFISKLKPVIYNQNPEILHRIWGTPDSLVAKMDFSKIKAEKFIGFLAQDVEKAANECGFKFPGLDAPKNDKEVYSLRYVDFIMPMVKSIQEQQEIITKQGKMIEDLQTKMQEFYTLKAELSQIKSLLLQSSNQEMKASLPLVKTEK
jgi:trimeric autotransporter adhesin